LAISPNPPTQATEQNVLNATFDKTTGLLAVELVGYDSVNNQLVRIAADANGNLVPGQRATGTATATNTTSTLIIAADATRRIYVRSMQFSNTGSTTVGVTVQDGSGGTALAYSIVPAGGGSNIRFEIPIATTAATALYFACDGSSTTVRVSAQGYLAA